MPSKSPDPFRALGRDARAWLAAPDAERLEAVVRGARAAAKGVPEGRREDWAKLVAGFAREAPEARVRARVEALVRACDLFGEARGKAAAPRVARARVPAAVAADDPVDVLPGLGPAGRAALHEAGVQRVADLVWTMPIAWDDARAPLGVRAALEASAAPSAGPSALPPRLCVHGVVKSAGLVPMRGRRAIRVVVADEEDPRATVHLWWFFFAHGVLAVAKAGAKVLLVGRVRRDPGKPARMIHPELRADGPEVRVVRPRYPRLGTTEAAVRTAIAAAMDRLARLPDPVPEAIAAREGFPPARELLRAVHGEAGVLEAPPSDDVRRAARERLAWGEAFTRVWERLTIEARQGDGGSPVLPENRAASARFRAELGFALTAGQAKAIATIGAELARPVPMRRLLLGDVGTGKTAVAMAAAAQCVAAGHQVAVLAPTGLLAEQYMDAMAPLARATGASIALFAAGVPAPVRRRAEEGLARGAIAVAVGTHALLGEGLTFARLGLVIVDEQHRLGVAQRLALVQKGVRPHLLTLTATPIPRTLALALRGELATSVLDERPAGRPPVVTESCPRSRFPELVADVRAAAERGERTFVISPRIAAPDDDEEDEGAGAGKGGARIEASSAERLAEALRSAVAPHRVALVHGGMTPEAKRDAMRAFRSGEAAVLVGTTVLEVGIDVPEATRMIIDEATRFGLAQLHQLRGRVGRGDRPGRCVLLYDEPIDAVAAERLRVLCTTSRGADVAAADLALRGAGDLGGTRQSGAEAELLYLDPDAPPAWLARIEGDARAIFDVDPALGAEAHRDLARMVERVERVIAVREEAG